MAVVSFSFDGRSRTVWIDDADRAGAVAGHLCERHAARMRPPRGWTIHERRSHGRELAADAAPAEVNAVASAPDPPPAWSPTARPDAELDAVLDARTPLLARAFRSARGR